MTELEALKTIVETAPDIAQREIPIAPAEDDLS